MLAMRVVRNASIVLFAASMFVSAASFAAQPAPPPPTQPAGGDNDQPGYRGAPPPYVAGDAYRGYVTDFPAQEVDAVPVARAQSARYRAEHTLAMRQLHRWIDQQWDDYLHSREYTDAANAEKQAQDAYARERDRVIKRLAQDSNYKTLVDLVADLNARIEQERCTGKASPESLDNVLAVATVKMGYASTLSAMEAAALAADGAVQDARNKLVDASNKTRQMREQFGRSIRHDQDFVAGRDRMDELMVDRITADAFLDSAIHARNIALRYSWYLHRWDQYRNSVYGLYGYGTYGGYGYGGYGFGGVGYGYGPYYYGAYQPIGYAPPPPPGAYVRRY